MLMEEDKATELTLSVLQVYCEATAPRQCGTALKKHLLMPGTGSNGCPHGKNKPTHRPYFLHKTENGS